MKKLLTLSVMASLLFTSMNVFAQEKKEDKSKRPSPPATATARLASGAMVTIDYSQPSVKGRTIGKNIEPKNGEVWRTGANEATVFETSKPIKVNGQALPAGKYALFSVVNDGTWTIIFNKTWNQWGAYDYKKADDALKVTAKATKAATFAEKMTFVIAKDGTVQLLWGDNNVQFKLD